MNGLRYESCNPGALNPKYRNISDFKLAVRWSHWDGYHQTEKSKKMFPNGATYN